MKQIIKFSADIIALAVIYAVFLFPKWRRRGKRVLLVRTLMYIYLSMVLFVTLMPVLSSLPHIFSHSYEPMDLVAFDDYFSQHGDFRRQIILNVIMLMPFGFLLPIASESARREKFTFVVGYGLLLSLAIELLQPLINASRSSDITDLITNTLGCALGYLLYRLFRPLVAVILRKLD